MSKDTDTKIAVVDLQSCTDEQRSALADLAISMYRNEVCRFCRTPLTTNEDLNDSVYTGYHEVEGRLSRVSHGRCWRALSDGEQERFKAEQHKGAAK